MRRDREGADQVALWPEGGLESVSACPICGGLPRSTLYQGLADYVSCCAPGLWTFVRCAHCRAAYLDPRPTRATIALAYATYFTHGPAETTGETPASERRQAFKNGYLNRRFGYAFEPSHRFGPFVTGLSPLHKQRCARLVRSLPCKRGGRLLDVGCGNGTFLELMRSQGWETYGVDSDPDAVAVCRAKGLSVQPGTVDECDHPEEFFDAVTLNHVIEHLHDPVAVLRRCRALIAPGGRLWLETPNLGAVSHRVFGRHWRGLEPPRHLVLFGPAAIHRACELAGFASVRVSGAPGAFGTSAASRLVRQRAGGNQPAATRTWSDRLADLIFDLVGISVRSAAQNLVATATRA